jgi:hypothetical protein
MEVSVHGVTARGCATFLDSAGAGLQVLMAVAENKRVAGQTNVMVRALGILFVSTSHSRTG